MSEKKKLLFVCAANINRSPTFEKYFRNHYADKYEVRSTGTYHGYPYKIEEVIEWADVVYVMDLSQAKHIKYRFPEEYKKVKVIGISDQYDTNDPALFELIKFWIDNCWE